MGHYPDMFNFVFLILLGVGFAASAIGAILCSVFDSKWLRRRRQRANFRARYIRR